MNREAYDIARCTVDRLMRDLGLQDVIHGKPVKTTISDNAAPCPLDQVSRQFYASATGIGLHLRRDLGGGLIDYSDRQPIRVDQVNRALGRGWDRAFHGQRLRQLRQHLGRDNQWPLQREVIHRRGPCRLFKAVEYATLEWVDWFNNRRLPGHIGNIAPAEAADATTP